MAYLLLLKAWLCFGNQSKITGFKHFKLGESPPETCRSKFKTGLKLKNKHDCC